MPMFCSSRVSGAYTKVVPGALRPDVPHVFLFSARSRIIAAKYDVDQPRWSGHAALGYDLDIGAEHAVADRRVDGGRHAADRRGIACIADQSLRQHEVHGVE